MAFMFQMQNSQLFLNQFSKFLFLPYRISLVQDQFWLTKIATNLKWAQYFWTPCTYLNIAASRVLQVWLPTTCEREPSVCSNQSKQQCPMSNLSGLYNR